MTTKGRARFNIALSVTALMLPAVFSQATAGASGGGCADYCCSDSSYCQSMYYDAGWCRTATSLGGGETVCCDSSPGYCCMQQTGSCLT